MKKTGKLGSGSLISSKFTEYSVLYIIFSEKNGTRVSRKRQYNETKSTGSYSSNVARRIAHVCHRLITHSLGTENHSPLAGKCWVLRT